MTWICKHVYVICHYHLYDECHPSHVIESSLPAGESNVEKATQRGLAASLPSDDSDEEADEEAGSTSDLPLSTFDSQTKYCKRMTQSLLNYSKQPVLESKLSVKEPQIPKQEDSKPQLVRENSGKAVQSGQEKVAGLQLQSKQARLYYYEIPDV